jgi:NAD(P)-dependent dehydrogenase (short-subunit alcohol dehydrogenase family)
MTAVVTGSGGGIGLATGVALARRAVNVVLADVLKDRLDRAIAAFDGPVHGVVMDIKRENRLGAGKGPGRSALRPGRYPGQLRRHPALPQAAGRHEPDGV